MLNLLYWVSQQWLSHTGEAENPVVAKSLRPESSAVPVWCWRPGDSWKTTDLQSTLEVQSFVLISVKECRSSRQNVDEFASEGKGKEQNLPSSMSLYRLPAEGVAQIKDVSSWLRIQINSLCLPASKDGTRSGLSHIKPSRKPLRDEPSISGV